MLSTKTLRLSALFSCVFLVTCCFFAGAAVDRAFCQEPEGVIVTRWIDPDGRKPISHSEWKAKTGDRGPFEISTVTGISVPKAGIEGAKFCIIVNSSLYSQIESSLDQYVLDLISGGYDIEVCTTSHGTPEDLRAFLQGRYSTGLEGCVLIGDLPIVWYETMCWEDPVRHEEFPCDLFYMDMDGVFGDSDEDGLYDTHVGDVAPEIWIGRLTASPLTMGGADEVSLLQNYFQKNHLYRTRLAPLNQRALVYLDDDWSSITEWDLDVGQAYDDRTFINDDWTTWAPDYENRLPANYESILVCVHSSPALHVFKNPQGDRTYTYNYEIKAIDPTAYFYNLFACSNARYVENDYMAGWYVFCDTYGLAAVGSAKTGAMLSFADFYQPFGDRKTIGESFRDWFEVVASDGFEDWEVCWHYGMTLIGDPTLVKSLLCVDSDGDGYGDPEHTENMCDDDNCPTDYNPGQEDADGIPPGDACCCVGLRGNVNGDVDDVLNISDITYLVEYLFGVPLGPIPPCPNEGNANGDGNELINISDISYLVEFLFGVPLGPAPPPCP